MILPIYAYGHKVLKTQCSDIKENTPNVQILIKNMFETMNNANGVGLAAPQIGESLNLFITDASSLESEEPELASLKKVFINPRIIEQTGEKWGYEEGCLSIPGIREKVVRLPSLTIQYLDEKFNSKIESFNGIAARIIQHEYDHIQGVLFVDHLSVMRKKLLKKKLTMLINGKIKVNYLMKFVNQKK